MWILAVSPPILPNFQSPVSAREVKCVCWFSRQIESLLTLKIPWQLKIDWKISSLVPDSETKFTLTPKQKNQNNDKKHTNEHNMENSSTIKLQKQQNANKTTTIK